MAHCNTVFNQLLRFVPRHEIENLSAKHHRGRRFRTASRWSQFVTMAFAQLSGRCSLRDVIEGLSSQAHKLYHLGAGLMPRSTLSRLNQNKPAELYEEVFGRLLQRCQSVAPGHGFRFQNKLYSLDATTIDLCLSVFPWARFRRTKGGVKLNLGLNHEGYLPEFVDLSEAAHHEVNWARTLKLPQGSIAVFDRGFTDYGWYKQLTDQGIFFVTRLKGNADYRVTDRRPVNKKHGLICDQSIEFTGYYAHQHCPDTLRRVHYRDPESGQTYAFLTNAFHLSAKTIADIYKARWQVELFFKWIKQNLKIKTFFGTSKNAVMTQIWIALCIYLMLAYLKFKSKLGLSLQQMLRLLHLNLFERRDLMALLKGDPPDPPTPTNPNQMALI
jgi:hypothetical protein